MKKESSSYLDTSFYYLRKTEECNIVVKTSRTVNDGFDDNVHSIHACTVRYDSHYP